MHCHNLRSKRPDFSFNDIQRLTCTEAMVLNFEPEVVRDTGFEPARIM